MRESWQQAYPDGRNLDRRSCWPESLTFSLLFCGYPLASFLPEFVNLPERAPSIIFRAICLLLSLWVVVRGRSHLGIRSSGLWLIVAFWVIYFARTVFDYYFIRIPAPMKFFDFTAYAYGVSFFGMLAMFAVRDWRKLRHAPLICILLCAGACLLAVFYGVSNQEDESIGRLFANQRLNPITLGHTATTLIVTAMWYLFMRRGNDDAAGTNPAGAHQPNAGQLFYKTVAIVRYPLLVLVIPLGLYALALSASRSPTLALVACLIFFALWLRARSAYLAVLAITAAVMFIEMGFLADVLSLGIDVDRLTLLHFQDENYTGGRTQLYAEAWSAFISSPIIGRSLFLNDMAYPHNLLLEALMATGLCGTVFLLIIFGRVLKTFYREIKGNPTVFWLFLLFTQAFIGTMTSGSIFYDPMIWTTLGVGLGLVPTPPQFTGRTGSPYRGLALQSVRPRALRFVR